MVVSSTVAQVNAAIESLWPLDAASDWDAPGLVSGDPHASVERVHIAVDAVSATVDEAIAFGADVLLVHHPLLLRGVTSIAETGYKGSILARLIRGGCALVAAHTNADVVAAGTSAVFADRLGLTDVTAILPGTMPNVGIGRVGDLPEPLTLRELAARVAEIVPATASGLRVAGDPDATISRVALCGGAGDSLLSTKQVIAADVYITSDLRHHPASESRENARLGFGPSLIDVSHWASESLWLDVAAHQLRGALPGVVVTVSAVSTDPWDFVVLHQK